MSTRNLNLEIGGRRYAVSCASGEEERISGLGRAIDDRARRAGATGQSEPRMLLFAALMLADELYERSGADPQEKPGRDDAALAQRIDAITRRIENIARHLEGEDHHA